MRWCGAVQRGASQFKPVLVPVPDLVARMSQKTSRVEHEWTLVCGICFVVDASVFAESKNPNHSRVEASLR